MINCNKHIPHLISFPHFFFFFSCSIQKAAPSLTVVIVKCSVVPSLPHPVLLSNLLPFELLLLIHDSYAPLNFAEIYRPGFVTAQRVPEEQLGKFYGYHLTHFIFLFLYQDILRYTNCSCWWCMIHTRCWIMWRCTVLALSLHNAYMRIRFVRFYRNTLDLFPSQDCAYCFLYLLCSAWLKFIFLLLLRIASTIPNWLELRYEHSNSRGTLWDCEHSRAHCCAISAAGKQTK